MGAWIRKFERRTEREILDRRPSGIPALAAFSAVESSRSKAEQLGEDPRSSIPPLGLREYWYPALPAKKVRKKPLYWNMLGEDLVLFRDKQGEVAVLSDICPHRGASLSGGTCFYRGPMQRGHCEVGSLSGWEMESRLPLRRTYRLSFSKQTRLSLAPIPTGLSIGSSPSRTIATPTTPPISIVTPSIS